MSHSPSVIVSRTITATRIPSGEAFEIEAGVEVLITQSLGGSFTVLIPAHAGLYRVDGTDADAIGAEMAPIAEEATTGSLEERIWAQLKSCYDPEIPVNIVDLGLVYELMVSPVDGGGNLVQVQMTLTAPGCGMGPVLAADARQKILALPGVTDAVVDVVWEPAWSPERISAAGREKLGI